MIKEVLNYIFLVCQISYCVNIFRLLFTQASVIKFPFFISRISYFYSLGLYNWLCSHYLQEEKKRFEKINVRKTDLFTCFFLLFWCEYFFSYTSSFDCFYLFKDYLQILESSLEFLSGALDFSFVSVLFTSYN